MQTCYTTWESPSPKYVEVNALKGVLLQQDKSRYPTSKVETDVNYYTAKRGTSILISLILPIKTEKLAEVTLNNITTKIQ